MRESRNSAADKSKLCREMGKTVNHDEGLHPTDLETARLVLVSKLARTVASLSSSDC